MTKQNGKYNLVEGLVEVGYVRIEKPLVVRSMREDVSPQIVMTSRGFEITRTAAKVYVQNRECRNGARR